MRGFIDGIRAAFAGVGTALGSREVWRSYALIALAVLVLSVGLDVLGIWGIRSLTQTAPDAAWWILALVKVARILGILLVVLLAPLISIFAINILVPVFNEVPFLAGMRSFAPERAEELAALEGLDTVSSIVLSLFRLGVLLGFNLFAFALSFIPVVGVVIGPVTGLLLTARQLGWELLDPYFVKLGMRMDAQRAVVRAHRGAIIGFGLPFALLFAVPVLGPLCFAWAQAAAARLVVDVIEATPPATADPIPGPT